MVLGALAKGARGRENALCNVKPTSSKPSQRETYTNVISACLQVVAEDSMNRADKEAVEENDHVSDICIVYMAEARLQI